MTTRLRLGKSPVLPSAYAITPGADRSVTFDISPIGESNKLRRTVNGELRFVGRQVFRKFAISISGRGRRNPEISGLFPGMEIYIETPEPIYFDAEPTGRVIVESVGVRLDRSQVSFTGAAPAGVVSVGYRLGLTCLVTNVSVSVDENAKAYTWSLEAEEV